MQAAQKPRDAKSTNGSGPVEPFSQTQVAENHVTPVDQWQPALALTNRQIHKQIPPIKSSFCFIYKGLVTCGPVETGYIRRPSKKPCPSIDSCPREIIGPYAIPCPSQVVAPKKRGAKGSGWGLTKVERKRLSLAGGGSNPFQVVEPFSGSRMSRDAQSTNGSPRTTLQTDRQIHKQIPPTNTSFCFICMGLVTCGPVETGIQ